MDNQEQVNIADLFEYKKSAEKIAIVFGNEVEGVSPELLALAGNYETMQLPSGDRYQVVHRTRKGTKGWNELKYIPKE